MRLFLMSLSVLLLFGSLLQARGPYDVVSLDASHSQPNPPYPPHSPSLPHRSAQSSAGATDPTARRVNDRLAALQREAEELASQSRSLLGDLRKLEVERDLQTERATQAEAAAMQATRALDETTRRVTALEQEKTTQLPDIEGRLVDLYKRGRRGYVRWLFDANNVRDFARASRTTAAMVHITEVRIDEHRRTLEALKREQRARNEQAQASRAERARAERARAAAQRAVEARTALVAEIDRRRDLTAQLAGELDVAKRRLDEVASSGTRNGEVVAVPMAPFRGALEWPVPGRVIGRFGQLSGRAGGSIVRNGIEIDAPVGTPVHAVHDGTVTYAAPFTGFGTLVIVDHGNGYQSVYGYLSSTSLGRGDTVQAGTDMGQVGSAPGGQPSLYFEMRVDGRSVDPVQWLANR